MFRMLLGVLLIVLLYSPPPVDAVVIEDFEDGDILEYTMIGDAHPEVTPEAAHDGQFGLLMRGNQYGLIYRDDPAVQVAQGDVISFWARTDNMTLWCGFGASPEGCYALWVSWAAGAFGVGKWDSGYSNYAHLDYVDYPDIEMDYWYRLEARWSPGGVIEAFLYDSDGTTLLTEMIAFDETYSSGGIAFYFNGPSEVNTAYFDTVERNPGAVQVEESTWGKVKSLF